MPSYWWQCDNNEEHKKTFKQATGIESTPHFIRDILIPSGWDQEKLIKKCDQCNGKLYITYEFPRAKPETIRVIKIIGIGKVEDEYIPMMWETRFKPYNEKSVYDFIKECIK